MRHYSSRSIRALELFPVAVSRIPPTANTLLLSGNFLELSPTQSTSRPSISYVSSLSYLSSYTLDLFGLLSHEKNEYVNLKNYQNIQKSKQEETGPEGEEERIGKIIARFSNQSSDIRRARVKLEDKIHDGDVVRIHGNNTDFYQSVTGLKIDNHVTDKASSGDVASFTLKRDVNEGDTLYLAYSSKDSNSQNQNSNSKKNAGPVINNDNHDDNGSHQNNWISRLTGIALLIIFLTFVVMMVIGSIGVGPGIVSMLIWGIITIGISAIISNKNEGEGDNNAKQECSQPNLDDKKPLGGNEGVNEGKKLDKTSTNISRKQRAVQTKDSNKEKSGKVTCCRVEKRNVAGNILQFKPTSFVGESLAKIKLKTFIKRGDTIRIFRDEDTFEQKVKKIFVDGKPTEIAKQNDNASIHLSKRVGPGDFFVITDRKEETSQPNTNKQKSYVAGSEDTEAGAVDRSEAQSPVKPSKVSEEEETDKEYPPKTVFYQLQNFDKNDRQVFSRCFLDKLIPFERRVEIQNNSDRKHEAERSSSSGDIDPQLRKKKTHSKQIKLGFCQKRKKRLLSNLLETEVPSIGSNTSEEDLQASYSERIDFLCRHGIKPSERDYWNRWGKVFGTYEGLQGGEAHKRSQYLAHRPNNQRNSLHNNSSRSNYYRQIPDELLSPDEELSLAKKIQAGDKAARRKFIEHNLRLPISIANNYGCLRLNSMDLIQEGNLGLIQAVDRFDPSLGNKFSTYATYWIRQRIYRAINHSRIVRVPEHIMSLQRKLQKGDFRLDKSTDIEEAAKRFDVSENNVKLAIMHREPIASLDQQIFEQSNEPSKTFNPTSNPIRIRDLRSDFTEEAEWDYYKRRLYEYLEEELTERARRIIQLRYGLGGEEERTLEEVGEVFGVSRERIRQIQASALEDLGEIEELEDLSKEAYSLYLNKPVKKFEIPVHQ